MKDTEDKLLRTLAELENQRRRYEKEKDEAYEFGGMALAKECLNLTDNLERSKLSIINDESLNKLRKNILEKAEEYGFPLTYPKSFLGFEFEVAKILSNWPYLWIDGEPSGESFRNDFWSFLCRFGLFRPLGPLLGPVWAQNRVTLPRDFRPELFSTILDRYENLHVR